MYIPNPPPGEAGLLEYLQNELQRISIALQTMVTPRVQYAKLYEAPQNPREGIVVLADGANWDPGSGSGLYIYIAGVWQPLFVEGGMEDIIAALPAQLTEIEEAVDTKAPADTALSVSNWTDARAGYLDVLNAGGIPGTVKSIQLATFNTASASATYTITAVTTSKTFLIPLGTRASSDYASSNGGVYSLTNSTTVTLTRSATDGTMNGACYVIELY